MRRDWPSIIAIVVLLMMLALLLKLATDPLPSRPKCFTPTNQSCASRR